MERTFPLREKASSSIGWDQSDTRHLNSCRGAVWVPNNAKSVKDVKACDKDLIPKCLTENILQGYSTESSDVVKLFLSSQKKKHNNLGSKWKIFRECFLCCLSFWTYYNFFDMIKVTNALSDEKRAKIIKIQKSKIKFMVIPLSMVNRKTFTYTLQVFINNFVTIVSIPKLNNIRQLSWMTL